MKSLNRLVRGLALVGSLAFLASSASAGEFTADCSGWWIKGGTTVEYRITAVATLQRLVDGQYVDFDQTSDSIQVLGTICLMNTWSVELPDGEYRATAVETIEDVATGNSMVQYKGPVYFTCVNVATRTPGYWKNHPEAWPVLSLSLGSGTDQETYSQDCLLELLDTEVQGDVRIILAKHLIAAKLNVLAGCPDSVATTITNADVYLGPYLQAEAPDCPNPFFSGAKPSGAHKQDGVGLKDILDAYNNLGES